MMPRWRTHGRSSTVMPTYGITNNAHGPGGLQSLLRTWTVNAIQSTAEDWVSANKKRLNGGLIITADLVQNVGKFTMQR